MNNIIDYHCRMEEIFEKDFYEKLLSLNLSTDQLFNTIYFILYTSCSLSIDQALEMAIQDGYPIIHEQNEYIFFCRKYAVMLALSDIRVKNLNSKTKIILNKEVL